MTTKQYLSQYKKMMEECRCLDIEIEELFTQLTSATSSNDGMPKGSVQDHQTKLHAIMADKLKTKRAKKAEAEELMAEILLVIDQITDPIYRQLLFERYIQDKEWVLITEDLKYESEEYVRGKLHGKALNEVTFIMG